VRDSAVRLANAFLLEKLSWWLDSGEVASHSLLTGNATFRV